MFLASRFTSPLLALLIAAALLPALARHAREQSRGSATRAWFAFATPCALLGLPPYLRNLALTGNPLYPVALELPGGMLPGLFTREATLASRFHLDSTADVFALLRAAFGVTGLAVMAAGLAGGALCALLPWGDRRLRTRAAALAACLVVVPYNTNTRFLFPAWGLLVAAAASSAAAAAPRRPGADGRPSRRRGGDRWGPRLRAAAGLAGALLLLVSLPAWVGQHRLQPQSEVAVRFLLPTLFAGASFGAALAMALSRARRRFRLVLAALIAALCLGAAETAIRYRGAHDLDILGGDRRYAPYVPGWRTVAKLEERAVVAYAGINLPYPLRGTAHRHRVLCVPLDGSAPSVLPHESARRQGRMPSRTRVDIDPRRLHPNRHAWLLRLRKLAVRYLAIALPDRAARARRRAPHRARLGVAGSRALPAHRRGPAAGGPPGVGVQRPALTTWRGRLVHAAKCSAAREASFAPRERRAPLPGASDGRPSAPRAGRLEITVVRRRAPSWPTCSGIPERPVRDHLPIRILRPKRCVIPLDVMAWRAQDPHMVSNSDFPMIIRDVRPGGSSWVNRLFSERTGLDAAAVAELGLLEWIEPGDRDAVRRLLEQGRGCTRARHLAPGRGPISMHWQVRNEEHGLVALGTGCDQRGDGPFPAPPGVARKPGDTLAATLRAMALIIEGQHPERRCSILLLEPDGRHVSVGAGPSLPEEYNAAVEGLVIGPAVGSCGTAAYWNQRVIVENIQEESLWRDLKGHAAKAGVAACWSHPIVSRSGEVLGALALYNDVPSAPSPQELSGLELAARMVGLAVQRGRAEEALRRSEAAARFQTRLLGAVTEVLTSFVDQGDWRHSAGLLLEATLELTRSDAGILGSIGDHPNDGGEPFADLLERGTPVSAGAPTRLRELLIRSPEARQEPVQVTCPETGRHLLSHAITVGGRTAALLCVERSDVPHEERDRQAIASLSRAGGILFDAYRRQQREAALEDHLQQAAKMEAIGVLAGGVAHDFNNLLMAVQGNAELALDALTREGFDESSRASVRSMLESINCASRKSSELCNQLLAYAGRGMRIVRLLECNQLIEELGDLHRVTLSKKARIEYRLSPDPLYFQADRSQFDQVVMNLITNAGEAIGEEEGRITVSTSTFHQEDSDIAEGALAGLGPAEYVCIEVADDGCGIPADHQDRIFDPFFTTKFSGRGLGLAAARGIVEGHGGSLTLVSEVGRGTTFTILLPREPAPDEPSSENSAGTTTLRDAHRCVLVVDDEEVVRNTFIKVFEGEGHSVLSAGDGREAVDVFSRHARDIDCVLLDWNMPRLNGEETLREIRGLRPDIPALLTSGFTEQEMVDRFQHAGFSGFVQKPTTRGVLLARLREALLQSDPRRAGDRTGS